MAEEEKKQPTKRYHVVNHAPGPRAFSIGNGFAVQSTPITLAPHGGEADVELTDVEYERLAKHPDLHFGPADEEKRRIDQENAAGRNEAKAKGK